MHFLSLRLLEPVWMIVNRVKGVRIAEAKDRLLCAICRDIWGSLEISGGAPPPISAAGWRESGLEASC